MMDDAALRRLREQPERAIEIRLAAAVRTGDEVQPAKRDHEVAKRSVAGDGERMEHEEESLQPEAADERLQLLTQEGERWRNEQMVLHARGVVVGVDDRLGHEGLARDLGRQQRIRNLAG